MVEYDWVFNGLRPQWIMSEDRKTYPKVTIHCLAYPDETYATAKKAIEAIEALSALKITNELTWSGGSDLQPSIDGEIIPISDGTKNYMGALYRPTYSVAELRQLPNYDDTMPEGTIIEFDLSFELLVENKDIVPDSPVTDIPTINNLITQGYRYTVPGAGVATKFLGTFTFNWNGNGHVYICDSPKANPNTDVISIDDAIVVTNGDGTKIDRVYGGGVYTPGNRNGTTGPALDITPLLSTGSNQLTIGIRDIYGSMLGCSPLYMVQV